MWIRIAARGRSTLGVALALVALSLVGCPTLGYREVQARFEEAVLADNDQLDPIIDRSEALYREVAASLSADEIEGLDEDLRANAWMIRSYSEWRSGQFAEARVSAAQGIAADPVEHSRDDVLLHLIPALVIDSEIMRDWLAADGRTDPDQYAGSQENDFSTALEKVAESRSRVGVSTPPSTTYYVEFQRWRILQNWRQVIQGIPDRTARNAARDRAKVDGQPLKDAAQASADAIPATHFLSARITSAGG